LSLATKSCIVINDGTLSPVMALTTSPDNTPNAQASPVTWSTIVAAPAFARFLNDKPNVAAMNE